MTFREGTVRQKLLFAVLVAAYVAGFVAWTNDRYERVGKPDVGWIMDGMYVSPTRHDASEAGLRGGGKALAINGVELYGAGLIVDPPGSRPTRQSRSFGLAVERFLNKDVGETNRLTFLSPRGERKQATISVKLWTWHDVAFTEGATFALGLLFFAVGLAGFFLRPYEPTSWALLCISVFAGGLSTIQFIEVRPSDYFEAACFRSYIAFTSVTPFHMSLVFPTVHPFLLRRPRVLWPIYGFGAFQAIMQVIGWRIDWWSFFAWFDQLDTFTLASASTLFLGRSLVLSVNPRDPLVAQRARILLAGTFFGAGPVVTVNFMRDAIGLPTIDLRIASWALAFFILALAYVTVRQDFVNSRIAVRRAIIYAVVVGVLTALAVALVAVKPYAVALLLLPLLYWWPRFDDRLNEWLNPKRARFPEIVRAIGDEIVASGSVDRVLDVLARAPGRLCDAHSSTAFVFAGMGGVSGHVRAAGNGVAVGPEEIAEEPLIQLMSTMRKEVQRDHVAVGPQYSNVRRECYEGFDRLHAVVVLPLVRDNRVVGGLAVGPRRTGDVYESADLQALSSVVQQAVQGIARAEATERLRAREMEFADLKRFFPPQIIDQVMAQGGVAELRTQRKIVTVFFADLRGFTSFSDSVEPEEVMATLAEYHALMGGRIAEFAGTLERFAGDGFMVFFNDPVEQQDHVERAVRMALAMQEDMRELRSGWDRKGYRIDIGIGIHTGYATCGFVGYEGRRDYGVIGNVTNLAARLSDAASPGEVLVSGRVRGELQNGYQLEPVGELELKGFHQAQAAFRLLGRGS